MIEEPIKKIAESIGIIGILITIALTTTIWLYYDFSERQAQLTAVESTGVFVVCLFFVAAFNQFYKYIKSKKNI